MLRPGFALLCSICISPVFAQENPVNGFTGMWARNSFNFEPIPDQPAPLVNLKRNADGTMDAGQIVGDYKNSILTPEAAEIARKKGESSQNWRALRSEVPGIERRNQRSGSPLGWWLVL